MSSLPIALRRNAYWNGRQNKKKVPIPLLGVSALFLFCLIYTVRIRNAPLCRPGLSPQPSTCGSKKPVIPSPYTSRPVGDNTMLLSVLSTTA